MAIDTIPTVNTMPPRSAIVIAGMYSCIVLSMRSCSVILGCYAAKEISATIEFHGAVRRPSALRASNPTRSSAPASR